jgi:hypothetical protein
MIDLFHNVSLVDGPRRSWGLSIRRHPARGWAQRRKAKRVVKRSGTGDPWHGLSRTIFSMIDLLLAVEKYHTEVGDTFLE